MYEGPQIYLLRNKDLPYSKIGFTRRTAELRAKEYTRGGEWTVQKFWPVREMDVEAAEYYFHELFYDFGVPHVDSSDEPENIKWLEIFSVHPDYAVLIIDNVMRLSEMLDKDVFDCPRAAFPTDEASREKFISLWKVLRDRNFEMYKMEFGKPPPESFWDIDWHPT